MLFNPLPIGFPSDNFAAVFNNFFAFWNFFSGKQTFSGARNA